MRRMAKSQSQTNFHQEKKSIKQLVTKANFREALGNLTQRDMSKTLTNITKGSQSSRILLDPIIESQLKEDRAKQDKAKE